MNGNVEQFARSKATKKPEIEKAKEDSKKLTNSVDTTQFL